MGSAFAAYIASKTLEGDITGNGPQNPDRRAEWLATNQPNSIRMPDGSWMAIKGLEPLSMVVTGVASASERNMNGETNSASDTAVAIVRNLVQSMQENSYLSGIGNFLEAFAGTGKQGENRFNNYAAGLASTGIPAIVRGYARTVDPAERSMRGNGLEETVGNRLASSIPGMTESLPQKFDVYGRPLYRDPIGGAMVTRLDRQAAETDPTIIEMERLSRNQGRALTPPVDRSFRRNNETVRLNEHEYQQYQYYAGYWTTQGVQEAMADPVWQTMTDEQKREEVRQIARQARADARDELFPDTEGVNESN